MPRNGTGSYSLPQPAFTPGTTISSAAVNSDLSDIASALTGSVSADGQTTITGQLKFPNGSAAAPAVTFASDLTTGMYFVSTGVLGFATSGVEIAQFNAAGYGSGSFGNVFGLNAPATGGASSGIAYVCPVGTVIDFAGTGAPSGWLQCFGQAVSATSYPELFNVLGTTYGTSAGNVVLPDCRGRASYGIDNGGAGRITPTFNFNGNVLGNTGGSQIQTLTNAQLPAHTHNYSGTTGGGTTGTGTTGVNSVDHTHGAGSGAIDFLGISGVVSLNTAAGTQNIARTSQTGGASVTHTHTVPGLSVPGLSFSGTTDGGSGGGTAHTILSPAIIFNKLIFAGRP